VTRPSGDDPEVWAHRRTTTESLPLFDASASIEAGMAARDETAARHSAEIQKLVPLAQELAQRSPEITVSDLRLFAVQRGLLTGTERGRELSYLGKVMEAAGLVGTGKYVRSSIVKAHGNLNATWRLPESREGAA
jgi:hypothetical protein